MIHAERKGIMPVTVIKKRNKWLRKLLIFAFLLSITYPAYKLFQPLVSPVFGATTVNTYDSLANKITQTLTHTPNLKDNQKLIVKCDSELLLTKKISNTEYNLICVKKNTASTAPTPTVKPTATTTAIPTSTTQATPAVGGATTDKPGQKCSDERHNKYVTTGPDGKQYPTWHPPADPETGCFFGHEHGSDPHKLPNLNQIGMPAFGYTAGTMGMTEPHQGFKVYVADDSERGYWLMSTFHMGTSGAKRAFEHHHTHDMVVVRKIDNKVLANVHLLAETGESRANCPNAPIIPGTEPIRDPEGKGIPTSDNPCDNFYESWRTITNLGQDPSKDTASYFYGKIFSADIVFDTDNGITTLKRLPDGTVSNSEVVWTSDFVCNDGKHTIYHPGDGPVTRPYYPYFFDGDCNRTGDKRGYGRVHFLINNTTGNQEIWSDALGILKNSGEGIKQLVSTSDKVDQYNIPDAWKGISFSNGILGDNDMDTYYPLSRCDETKTFCNNHNHAGNAFITFPN